MIGKALKDKLEPPLKPLIYKNYPSYEIMKIYLNKESNDYLFVSIPIDSYCELVQKLSLTPLYAIKPKGYNNFS